MKDIQDNTIETNLIKEEVSGEMLTTAFGLLKKYFGYSSFKKGQLEIIKKIILRQDVLGIMPTGAGKSICFQIPALMREGVTIVITPLISLMKDQVDALTEAGIKAVFINSSLGQAEIHNVIENVKQGVYKLLYITPERLESESFLELLRAIPISLVAVDEAHCVSQWGHDFRPSYIKIAKMIKQLKQRPVVASFTATATEQVKTDIISLLKLQNPYLLTTGFDRENLYFEVAKPKSKFDVLLKYLNENSNKAGIIYCTTRKTVESVNERLIKKGFLSVRYHAGLSEKERNDNQEAFLYDRAKIMVATNAFGMGIDKSNIGFVIHYNMPKTLENYYQEAGRAGRDGEKAECILFFSAADIVTNKLLIENSGDNVDKSGEYQRLNEMIDYCNTDKCLRAYILEYFGEQNVPKDCGYCGNCSSEKEYTDITIEAQKILSCIKRMDERFGGVLVADVLKGANTQRIKKMGFDKLTTYGIMKEYPKDTIKELISFLTAEDYITLEGDEYPVLRLNSKSYDVLKGKEIVKIKRLINQKPVIEEKNEGDKALLEVLKGIRKSIADKHKVPAFVIFSDATLNEMCKTFPTSEEKMKEVPGVGNVKLQKYGEQFISAIQQYVVENNIKVEEIETLPTEKQDKEEPEPKINTRQITYDLFISGKTVEEIARERNVLKETIEKHLIECLYEGLELDYQSFIPEHMEPQIVAAIKQYGTERLKPIKEALPQEVTYTAIRFAIYKCSLL